MLIEHHVAAMEPPLVVKAFKGWVYAQVIRVATEFSMFPIQ